MVCVSASYEALGVSSDTLKGTVRHHLPQKNKFLKKDININDSYDGSKVFTTISESYIRFNTS